MEKNEFFDRLTTLLDSTTRKSDVIDAYKRLCGSFYILSTLRIPQKPAYPPSPAIPFKDMTDSLIGIILSPLYLLLDLVIFLLYTVIYPVVYLFYRFDTAFSRQKESLAIIEEKKHILKQINNDSGAVIDVDALIQAMEDDISMLEEYLDAIKPEEEYPHSFSDAEHERLMETNPYYRKKFQENYKIYTGQPHASEDRDKEIQAKTDAAMYDLWAHMHRGG